jgi:hypothetical protein
MKNTHVVLLLAMAVWSGGCALLRESEASSKEKMLVAAGFQIRPADTPQKQAALSALTPYRIQMRTKANAVHYSYADPKQNRLYIGGPKEYAAYQKLSLQQEIAEEQEMASMDWDMWGPSFW